MDAVKFLEERKRMFKEGNLIIKFLHWIFKI